MAAAVRLVLLSVVTGLLGAMALHQRSSTLNLQLPTSSDEEAYNKVVARKSNSEMSLFAKRLLGEMGGKLAACNEPQLNGIIPFYSGVITSRGYGQLIRELADAAWVDWSEATPTYMENIKEIQAEETDRRFELLKAFAQKDEAPGALAELSEAGYHAVAELRSDAQMEMFARRVLATHGGKVNNSGMLHGMLPFYSGVSAKQSLQSLVAELQRAPWVVGFRAEAAEVVSPTAPLSQEGYEKVLATKDNAEIELFIRRVAAARDATVRDEEAMRAQVKTYDEPPDTYETLVMELSNAKWLQDFNAMEARKRYSKHLSSVDLSRAKARGLSDAGYEAVAALKSNGEMGSFVKKILVSRGCQLTDRAAFLKWLPKVSGVKAKTTFPELLKDVQKAPFVNCGGL